MSATGVGDGPCGADLPPANRVGDLRLADARIVQVVFTVFSLAVTTAIMMNVVHLNPLSSTRDLVFDDTTPTGGDFGAHVWGPAFLRDHLLPAWRLNGWSMDWYAGMPAYRFYMVVPALLVVALDTVLAYGVALKVVVRRSG